MKKRFLAVLLALCLTLTLLPGLALAAEGDDSTTPPAEDHYHSFVWKDGKYERTCEHTDVTAPDPDLKAACDNVLAKLPDYADREVSAVILPEYLQDLIEEYAGANVTVSLPVITHVSGDTYEYTVKIVFNGQYVEITRRIRLNQYDADTYYIAVEKADNGEVIPNTRYAAAGERVTLTVHPADGYKVEAVTVTDIRGREVTVKDLNDSRFTFSMPSRKVTVSATFAVVETPSVSLPGTEHTAQRPDGEVFTGLGTPGISGIVLNPAAMPFTDVKGPDWFYNNVEYVWKHYLMSGVSDSQFSPNTTTSRGMIWTILARMNNVRTDINPGSTWYEKGMLWCKEQGVTEVSNPMGDITREQLATMLWRNAGKPTGNGDLDKFSDSAAVSEYAVTAVRWAVGNGILNGTNGQIDPQGTATRAQVAAMVARYGDKVVR